MVRPSVILSVHYRNHFPLSNFKTKHIFGILVERVNHLGRRRRPNFFLLFYRRQRRRKLTPRPGRPRRPKYGALMAPQFFFFSFSFHSFTAAKGGGFQNGRRRHLNGDAQRWRRWRHFPGGQGKPRRKREFASMFLNF